MITRNRISLVLSLWIAFVFIQSLFFKYTDAPETQHIFGTLDAWAETLGAGGIFSKTGPFSQYVIGTAELVASLLVLAGSFMPGRRILQVFGGLMAVGIMSGAISFHLFTPLGVDVQQDGGTLFVMACLVWLSGAALAFIGRDALIALLPGRASRMA